LVFGLFFWYFLNRIISNGGAKISDSIFGVVIFPLLIFGFSLLYFRFRVEIGDNTWSVRALFRTSKFLFSDIGSISVTQTPINKFFGLKNIIIELKDPKEWESVSIKAFGSSIKTFNAGMPGKYGGLVTIPSVSIKEADKIINELRLKSGAPVSDLGIGYPYHDSSVRLSYILVYCLLAVVLLIFIFWIYLSLKL